jgi:hypothetical protein
MCFDRSTYALDVGHDVAPSVGRTRLLGRALSPVHVREAVEAVEELKAELLEVRLIPAPEVEPVHARPV